MGLFGNMIKVNQLEQDLQNARALIKSLQADLDRLRDIKDKEVRKDVQSAEFVIDWKNMDAFSIERMGDPKEAYTVIGYWVIEGGEKRVHEWKFYCSLEQHNKLADQFKGNKK
jgi:hypothetical protein